MSTSTPNDYEALVRLIHDRFEQMSPSYRRIALFVTQNPSDVAVLSVNALANRCGIHASSFVRFAQALGYTGFKDLQGVFHQRLTDAAPGFGARLKSVEAELEAGESGHGRGVLRDLVVRDIAALRDLLTEAPEADLERAVRILERADTVYLIGQLRSAPVVELLRYALTMLGRRTILLDASGGLARRMARTIRARDALLAVSFRNYAAEPAAAAEDAAARGAPVIAITDSGFAPLAKSAAVTLLTPEYEHPFSRSLAAPICLAQALGVALAARLSPDGDAPRIPIATGDGSEG